MICRLGVNIDHVGTIRNARGGVHPDPLRAAMLAIAGGADGITAHLREDRRHMRDADIAALTVHVTVPLNLEMAATPEMQALALKFKPHAVCLVPERRHEVTTEGGLDVAGQQSFLQGFITPLQAAGIRVSLFIDPDPVQIKASHAIGAPVVELHTGAYAHGKAGELQRLQHGAALSESLGLECHAGHGLTFDNVADVAAIQTVRELNIGHFLMGEALFIGLENSVRQMRQLINRARV